MGIKHMFGVRAAGVVGMTALVAGTMLLSGCAPASDEANPSPSAARVTPQPVVTTPVPAPSGGTSSETVPAAEPGATVEVGFDETAELSDDVSIAVTETKVLDVAAETPGEIAGPAVALTLTVDNGTAKPIDLSTAMVSVTGSDGSLGQPTTSTPYAPFSGEVAPDDSATGTFVFLLPAAERDALSVTVEYVAGAPIALFVGDIN